MHALNETHDIDLRCWLDSANSLQTDFPIQNLPYAVFRRHGTQQVYRGGVAIGDQIVDLSALSDARVIVGDAAVALESAASDTLNAFMTLGPAAWSELRWALSRVLRHGAADEAAVSRCLVPQAESEFSLPARIGDYTDFYTSIHHATNIGRQFRPDNPLLPNYKWLPIGYHGRVSSIGISGQHFPRPVGQTKAPDASVPTIGPCRKLDYELELGIFIGPGNRLGHPISIAEAEQHVFGICLMNDWSARDIQAWEYQPLGPFLSKSFATTLSPWIVTLEALAPYRLPFVRPEADPAPLSYLQSDANAAHGAIDINLEVLLQSEQMRQRGLDPARLSTTSYRHAYWTVSQMLAHHTVNGCNLQPGDLIGSGTLSGPTLDQAGALIELTLGGKQPIDLPGEESRDWLDDGDAVFIRGWCERPGARRIGFGQCVGQVERSLLGVG